MGKNELSGGACGENGIEGIGLTLIDGKLIFGPHRNDTIGEPAPILRGITKITSACDKTTFSW